MKMYKMIKSPELFMRGDQCQFPASRNWIDIPESWIGTVMTNSFSKFKIRIRRKVAIDTTKPCKGHCVDCEELDDDLNCKLEW